LPGVTMLASVLCVDDDPVVLRTIELILQSAGYVVCVAANVADAFPLLKARHFDLLLLDCVPDRGWLVEEARRMNPGVRVALCTGDVGPADLPVDAVFHKPIRPPLLLRKISELLNMPAAA